MLGFSFCGAAYDYCMRAMQHILLASAWHDGPKSLAERSNFTCDTRADTCAGFFYLSTGHALADLPFCTPPGRNAGRQIDIEPR